MAISYFLGNLSTNSEKFNHFLNIFTKNLDGRAFYGYYFQQLWFIW